MNLRRNARSVSASICQERTRPISIIPFAIATHADKSPRPSSSLPSFRTRRSHAFLAAMARCSWNPASPGQGSGFLQHKVKEVDGRVWKKTNHDLDFLIVARRRPVRRRGEKPARLHRPDGIPDQACDVRSLRHPTDVRDTRHAGKLHLRCHEGGFSLLTDNQNYPLLADDLARRVRSTLNLPVGVIQQFPVTALDHLYVNPAGSPRKRVASPRAGSENQGFFNRY